MSKIHFFTDIDLLNQQTDVQAYGPVKDFEDTKYRVTSMFSLNSDTDAIAICDGIVIVHPQWDEAINDYDPDLVNILLKPLTTLKNNFTQVDYFIYRGLKRESFLNSNNEIPDNDPALSDYLKTIWDDFDAALALGWTTATRPSRSRIGYHFFDPSNLYPDEYSLREVFAFWKAQVDIPPFGTIKAGQTLGKFDASAGIGLEIILKDKLYDANIGTLKKKENIIVADEPDSAIPGNEPIQNMRKREQVLNFVDPVAFYMTFFNNSIFYFDGGVKLQTPVGSITSEHEAVKQVYNALALKFYTKNKVYIDIRNEYGYSLNYHYENQGEPADPDFGNHFYQDKPESSSEPKNYYIDYWPVYTLEIVNNSNEELNKFELRFRKDEEDEPLLFLEYAFLQIDKNSKFVPANNSKAFLYEDADLLPNNGEWTLGFKFVVPNLANPIGHAPAWLVKLKYIRRKTNNLLFHRHTYHDKLFGPIIPLPQIASGATIWDNSISLGKRYVDLRTALGFDAIVEITLLFSDKEVAYIATVVNSSSPANELNQLSSVLNLGIGSTIQSNLPSNIAKWYRDLVVVRKHQLPTADGNKEFPFIMKSPDQIADEVNPLLFGFCMTREEFNSRILPAATTLDAGLHDIYIDFSNLVKSKFPIRHYQVLVRVAGLDSNGNYEALPPTGTGNLLAYSQDGYLVATPAYGELITNDTIKLENATNPDAYILVEDSVQYIKTIEESFFERDLNNIENSAVKNTSTRVRNHYYGLLAPVYNKLLETLLREGARQALANAIKGAKYREQYPLPNSIRQIHRFYHPSDSYQIARKHLLAHADENSLQDNSSPYIQSQMVHSQNPNFKDNIDFGQVLYGFEALAVFPPGGTKSITGKGYHDYGKDENDPDRPTLKDPFDLAAIIANIAIPVVDVLLFDNKNVEKPGSFFTPDTADLLEFYEISAPDADLFGNVDALGIRNAWLNLKANDNPGLKLSDVLQLYYEVPYAGEKDLTNIVKEFYTYDERWIGFATDPDWQLAVKVSENVYKWMPDYPQDMETLDKILIKMENFCEFWYNRLKYPTPTGLRIAFNWVLIADNLKEIEKIPMDELNIVKELIDEVLFQSFFPYIKSKVELENSEISLI